MNNEKKAPVLTLEHLSLYLPYGLKCHNMGNTDSEAHPFVSEIVGLDSENVWVSHEHEDDDYTYSDTFPLLRPLSDLTKEIEHNGKRFVPISAILQRFGDSESIENALLWLMNGSYPYSRFSYCIIELLISWHFDVFRLIEKGLAIDINSIQEIKGGRK